MNLDAARALKERVRRAAQRPRFATGLRLGANPDDYRVVVLLERAEDRRWLDERIVREARSDLLIETTATPSPCSGGCPQPPFEPDIEPLRLGTSIGHAAGGIGSLGFFATRLSDGARGIVSCNHVIAMGDEGKDGDAVVCPSTLDGGGRVVASLDGSYPRLAQNAVADCAFARLGDDVPFDARTLPGGSLSMTTAPLTSETAVAKTGRATGATRGVLMSVEVDNVWIRYGRTRVAFHGALQIGAAGDERFCHYGDSGALVYTADTFEPLGLLFATAYLGGPRNLGWSWAHPLSQVTAALGVALTTG